MASTTFSPCHSKRVTMLSLLVAMCSSVLVEAIDFSNSTPNVDVFSDSHWDCASGLRQFDPSRHKQVYTIGLHAPMGVENSILLDNLTFANYLTATAGQRFDPPIEFRIEPTTRPIHNWVDVDNEVDFFYSDTGVATCIGVEKGAQIIATTVSRYNVRGHNFDLDRYAGKDGRL